MSGLWLLPAIPLAGALVGTALLALGRFRSERPPAAHRAATWVGCGASAATLAWALVVLARFLVSPERAAGGAWTETLFTWVPAGNLWTTSAGQRALEFPMAFQLDALSAVMLFVVTFVGFWIHLYSVGYMAGHRGYQRYFVYLNLFLGAMLLLVLGDNYLVLFMGWEGVGLCSYLLIGFDYEEAEPPRAGRKAFIVNRIGDFAFLVGMLALASRFGTLDFTELFAAIGSDPQAVREPYLLGLSFAGFVGLCLFIGAVGKSAQIPLYVWLPDAMAGPTPVSALIHAATMVTAGVYMVARSSALYAESPEILTLIAVVGTATALFAATIAVAQNDLKRVLAYSTVSQLGYMFLAAGMGAYSVAIFHLGTHAFFKALLFLGAGSVIHAMGGEQDMRRMGGLRSKLPITYWTFLIATLALAGMPPLAGFFSKDRILAAAWGAGGGGRVLWIVGLLTAGLTACYMLRAVLLTFHGGFGGSDEQRSHLHESPPVMTVPLVVLAVGSVVAGWVGIPRLGPLNVDWFGRFLDPVFARVGRAPRGEAAWSGPTLPAADPAHLSALGTELLLMGLTVAVAAAGLWLAWRLWGPGRELDGDRLFARHLPALRRMLENEYWVDRFYAATVVRGTARLASACSRFDLGVVDGVGVHGVRNSTLGLSYLSGLFDLQVVDGLVNAVGAACRAVSRLFRRLQTGWVSQHALTMVTGVLLLGAYCLFLWSRTGG